MEHESGIERIYRIKGRTKEAKVTSVNNGFCTCFTCHIIETRQTPSHISNAENASMDAVYDLCLRVDLGLRLGHGRSTRAG